MALKCQNERQNETKDISIKLNSLQHALIKPRVGDTQPLLSHTKPLVRKPNVKDRKKNELLQLIQKKVLKLFFYLRLATLRDKMELSKRFLFFFKLSSLFLIQRT